jgi:putative exporter of polyketide antibiotics
MVTGCVIGVVTGAWVPFGYCTLFLMIPVAVITVISSVRHRRWAEMPGLAALYLTYSIARASALLRVEAWQTTGKRHVQTIS